MVVTTDFNNTYYTISDKSEKLDILSSVIPKFKTTTEEINILNNLPSFCEDSIPEITCDETSAIGLADVKITSDCKLDMTTNTGLDESGFRVITFGDINVNWITPHGSAVTA